MAAGFVVLSAVVSVVAAPALPERVISHWNAAGRPDGTMSKAAALALVPVMSAVLLGVFALIPRIDPLRENIAEFRDAYDWLVVVLLAYLFVVHAGIIAFNLGYGFDFTALLLVAIAALFYAIGVVLGRARRNWFVGIRTPWTLSSDEVWDRTHELGGRLFKVAAVLSLVGLAFGRYGIYFVIVPAVGIALFTVAYSYYLYERLDVDPAIKPNSGL